MHLYPKQILAQICPQSLDPPTFFCWDIFTFQVAWSDRFSDDANFESLVKPEANPSSEKHKKSCLSQHRSSPFPSRFPQQMSVLSYSCVSLTSALSDRNGQQSFFVCQGPETNFIHEWFHLSPSLQTSTRGCHFPLLHISGAGKGTDPSTGALSEEIISSNSSHRCPPSPSCCVLRVQESQNRFFLHFLWKGFI